MNQSIKLKIKEALLKAIQKTGKEAFNQTQLNVPVVTGELKLSGSETDIQNGAEISYKKEYASFVEDGTKEGIINVPSYVRKDGTRVKAYSYYSKGQRAQKYVEKGLTKAYTEEEFSNNFTNELSANLSYIKAKIIKQ